ncbi:MAG: hypothetical protein ACOY3P_21275 [Planctomycetota bacterium]
MTWIVGTDEAGYGPDLGPLVISASAWRVPESLSPQRMYDALAGCIVGEIGKSRGERLSVADSKRLYQPGRGLFELERSLFPLLAVLEARPTTWCELWNWLAPGDFEGAAGEPWHDGFELPLPTVLSGELSQRLEAVVRCGLQSAEVRLVRLRSRAVFPAEYNRLVDCWGGKGAMLSRLTIELARSLIAELDDEPVMVMCDKHGGRNRYAALLAEAFDQALITADEEGSARSIYRLRGPHAPLQFHFTAGGEACLPVALASTVSKYLRETAMAALNHFWCRRVPGLRPTAGYPTDARRFRNAIRKEQHALGIPDAVLWRER